MSNVTIFAASATLMTIYFLQEQWFCPGVKGTASSGFIAQRFRNYRQRKLSSIEKAELHVGKKSKRSRFSATLLNGVEDITVEFQQKQQWLKENNQPIEKVLQLMKETVQGRRYKILQGIDGDIIEAWPRLLIPQVVSNRSYFFLVIWTVISYYLVEYIYRAECEYCVG